MKRKTSFALTSESLEILVKLAGKRGISRSALLEVILREEEQREAERDERRGKR
jgi:hypothetical protein